MSRPRGQHCLQSLAMPWNTQWMEPHPLMNQVQKLNFITTIQAFIVCKALVTVVGGHHSSGKKGNRRREKATFPPVPEL